MVRYWQHLTLMRKLKQYVNGNPFLYQVQIQQSESEVLVLLPHHATWCSLHFMSLCFYEICFLLLCTSFYETDSKRLCVLLAL